MRSKFTIFPLMIFCISLHTILGFIIKVYLSKPYIKVLDPQLW